jgi:hypothetical protein
MRTRPVPQSILVAAEDVEYLLLRAEDFIKRNFPLSLSSQQTREVHAGLMAEYINGAVRLATKQA